MKVITLGFDFTESTFRKKHNREINNKIIVIPVEAQLEKGIQIRLEMKPQLHPSMTAKNVFSCSH